MRRKICRLMALPFVLAVPVSLLAQVEVTGRIVGTAMDATGAVLPGVMAKVEGPTLFEPRTTLTLENGTYLFDKLPVGTYRVSFSLSGFKTVEQANVNVRAGFTATINAQLAVGQITETLTVEETAPVVDVTSATASTTFDAQLLKDIPSGRDTWSTLAQVPGLQPSKFDVGGTESFQQTATQIHGSKSGQVVYSVNGLNLNWPGGNGGATAFYFDNDSFEEVQVVTDAAQAEVGVGGVYINQLTKQGTNAFRGEAFMNYTTAGLTSEYNRPVFNGRPIEAGNTITMMRDLNGQAGGPILRDRFWVFGSFRSYHINLAVPTAPRRDGSAPQDTNEQINTTLRGDYSISPKQKVAVVWLYNDILRYFRRSTAVSFVDEEASRRQLEHAWVAQAHYTFSPTSNLVLESRVGNMTLHFPLTYQPSVSPTTVSVQDNTLSTLRFAGESSSLNSTYHVRFAQTASIFKSGLGGSHNIRAGYEIASLKNANLTRINRDLRVFLSNGAPLFATLYNTPLRSVEKSHEQAFYLQDSFSIRRLTLNVGFRFDHFISFLPEQKSPAGTYAPERSFARSADIVSWNTIVPRVGVAYDLFGNGKTVVRGSFGHFAQIEGSRLPAALNPNALNTTNVTFTGLGPDNFPLGLGQAIFREGGLVTRVDPELKRPYSRQFTGGFEHQLMGDLRVGVGYYYRTLVDGFSRYNTAILPSDYTPIQSINPLTNQPMTIYNVTSPAKVGQQAFLITNVPDVDENAYHGLEVNATKRLSRNWQVLTGFTAQRWKGNFTRDLNDDFNNPNLGIFRANSYLENDASFVFKAAGTYNFPKGITGSLNFQHYTGYPFQPTAVFTTGLNQRTETIAVGTRGEFRYPDVNTVNLRVGYQRRIGERIRIHPAFDLYNVFNKNTVTTQVTSVGPNYGRASGIIGQRFARFALRLEF